MDDSLQFSIKIMIQILGGQSFHFLGYQLELFLQLVDVAPQTHHQLISHGSPKEAHKSGVDALVPTKLCLQVTVHALQCLEAHPCKPRPLIWTIEAHVPSVHPELGQIVANLDDLVRH
jgi:hypothetical protein